MHPHSGFPIPRPVRILALGVFLLASPLSAQWTFRGLYNQTITAFATDPSAPDTLWAGTRFGGVFQTADAGATWAALGPSPIAFGSVSSLALSPDSSTLYAGTSLDFLSRSADSSDWSAVFQGAVTSVAVRPSDCRRSGSSQMRIE